MMKSIFTTLVAVPLFVVALNSGAEAFCGFDKRHKPIPPVAIADDAGIVVAKTPTGGSVRVSGFEPGGDMCRNLLFPSANWKCPSGLARLAEERDPKFCKRGYVEGRTCLHVVCNGKGT
jgi:hypothetical protein